jgi:hypothetical protein
VAAAKAGRTEPAAAAWAATETLGPSVSTAFCLMSIVVCVLLAMCVPILCGALSGVHVLCNKSWAAASVKVLGHTRLAAHQFPASQHWRGAITATGSP